MSSRASAAKKTKVQPAQPAGQATPWFRNESSVLGVLLTVATILVYAPAGHHPFLNFDDPVYVVNNAHIASGLHWETITWAFGTFYQFNWHPLTWLSHALDVQLFQRAPGGHHVMNMLLATANVMLLFWVLRQATGYVGRSAMVAALFALHPVNVESVAWISERKNLLSMFFFLLGMAAYRWYAEAPSRNGAKSQVDASPNIGRYLSMTMCFAMGLMSKPQIITFPFLLLLWDYWPLERAAIRQNRCSPFAIRSSPEIQERSPRQKPESEDRKEGFSVEQRMANGAWRSFLWLVAEKIPLFAICAASAVVTIAAQRAGGAVASLQNYPLSVRITNAIVCYVRYIAKAVWPVRLAPLYPHPWQPLPIWQVLSSLLVLVAITAGVIVSRRRYLLVGWLWFLGALVPMIGIVHVGNQAMADRYAYLPYIGLFIAVCWGAAEFATQRHVPVAVVRTLSVVVLLALAALTHRQLSFWSDNATLWNHTIAVTDGNYIAHDNLAHVLLSEGKPDQALKHFQAALAIYPSDSNALMGIAIYEQQHGNLDQAIARYEQMASVTPAGPARAGVFVREGLVYLDMEDKTDARANFEKAVAMDPQNVQGWLGLGVVAERSGDLQSAISNFKHANAVKPLKVTYLLLAKALEDAGDISGAETAREQARLLPKDEQTTQTYSGGILRH